MFTAGIQIGAALVLTAAFLAPSSAGAAEPKTDCAQLVQSAQHLERITSEVKTLAGRVDATGSELAANFRGQAGVSFRSSSTRAYEAMRGAVNAMDETLEVAKAQCSHYQPIDHRVVPLHPTSTKMRTSGTQPWNFAAIEAAVATLKHDTAILAALADEWHSVQGNFEPAHQRADIKLTDARQALAQMARAADEAAGTMRPS
jgi:uncharacterized protein YukE